MYRERKRERVRVRERERERGGGGRGGKRIYIHIKSLKETKKTREKNVGR